MAELQTLDGDAVEVDRTDVNAKFDAAMNDDVPAEQTPPKRQPRAAADPAPEADRPRRGRPPKAEKARTTSSAAEPIKDDYTADASALLGAIWTVAASIPPTQPYAFVIDSTSGAWTSALAEGAKHNATVRGWLKSGESSWMLGMAAAGVATGMGVLTIMKDPEMREKARAATKQQLKQAMVAKGLVAEEPADAAAGA